jgi:Zn-dependent peptidase ImmA (M78 family)
MCREAEPISDSDRSLEREANIFAANLLMPEAAVRDAWQRHEKVELVAEAFGVSDEAMQWRLFGFGLVGEAPVSTWGAGESESG